MVLCQLMSDIHLEMYDGREYGSRSKIVDQILPESKGNGSKYLFLAGDISASPKSLGKFLVRLCNEGEWKRIFYVPGNHEYYGEGPNFKEVERKYILLERLDNRIICLHRNKFETEEFVAIGATLWSEATYKDFLEMNDGNKIRGFVKGKIQHEEILYLHRQDKEYIKQEVNIDYNKPVIILTHHAPSLLLSSDPNSSFYSNCDDLIKRSNYWFYGHTHQPMYRILYKCKIHSNPIGYPGELDSKVNYTIDVKS